MIRHDPALADEPELVQGVAAAAALALENERLDGRAARAGRGAARVAGADRRGRRRGAPPARARPPRRRPAAARRRWRSTCGSRGAKLDTDPAAARGAARRGAPTSSRDATDELRELARGIHPAVLTDRGLRAGARGARRPRPRPGRARRLDAAERAAAGDRGGRLLRRRRGAHQRRPATRSASRAEVGVEPRQRPARASRSATTASAAPTRDRASGLRGLADRVAALDGRLEVDEPARRRDHGAGR